MPRGGKREGAGKPKGKIHASTLEKRAVVEAFNQQVMSNAEKLFLAQSQLALGSMKCIRVDEERDGKGNIKRVHTHVTNTQEIIQVLNENDGLPGNVDGNYYFFADVLPSNQALDSLLNRSLGKPTETVEVLTDPKLTDLKQRIQARADDKGVSYESELRLFIDNYADNVAPDLRSKLSADLPTIG